MIMKKDKMTDVLEKGRRGKRRRGTENLLKHAHNASMQHNQQPTYTLHNKTTTISMTNNSKIVLGSNNANAWDQLWDLSGRVALVTGGGTGM